MFSAAVRRPTRHFGCLVTRYVQTAGKIRATREREVIESLGQVIEPISQQSLHNIAAIQSAKVDGDGNVHIELDFFVPGYPKTEVVRLRCDEVLRGDIPWIADLAFSFKGGSTSSTPNNDNHDAPMVGTAQSLRRVQHVIGVSSCKGGVGKSTTAVNLAATLARRGLSVGLLDADVYGPSLPYLLTPDELPVVIRRDPQDPKAVLPLVATVRGTAAVGVGAAGGQGRDGVIKFISFGHVNPKAGVSGAGGQGAAVIRGPIVSRVINQLIANTSWGELDYLLVDMPPGTGDIQITLNQSMSMTGSVLVTTPHPLALVDVLKGKQMMQAMHVPTLALVENMSHFTCDLGTRYFPFGRLDQDSLQRQLREGGSREEATIPVISFPLTSAISQSPPRHDGAIFPVVLGDQALAGGDQHEVEHTGAREVIGCYNDLADAVIGGVFLIQLGAQMLPQVTYSKAKKSVILRYYTATEAIEFVIPVVELRVRDAATGVPLPEDHQVPPTLRAALTDGSVHPISFDAKGNYGVGIVWSDGHFADIFPFSVLKDIARDCAVHAP